VNEPTQVQFDSFELLLHKRDYKRAEVLVAKALRGSQTTPVRVLWLAARARLRLQSGRVDDALLDMQKVISLQPDAIDQPHWMELLADCHLARYEVATIGFADRGDAEKARIIYERLLDLHADYGNLGWVRYQLGRALLIEYKMDSAVTCFQIALLEASTLPALTAYCYERLGFIHFYELRLLDRALHFLNKAVDTYPMSEAPFWLVQVHILRSRVLRELKRIDEAIDAARTSVLIAGASESKRGMADALLSISETLAPLPNRERETIQYLQQFVQTAKKPLSIDVTWARVYEMIGDAYLRSSQYVNALSAFEAALVYNPYTPWETSLHYRLARSAYQAGEYRRALKALERLLHATHADGDAVTDYRIYMLLGSSHYALNHYAEAVDAYAVALEMTPLHDPDRLLIQQYHQRASELAGRL